MAGPTATCCASEYQRGDADAALAASAHVVHETFRTQRIEHAFLEPESSLAVPDTEAGTALHVYSGGQGIWDDRDDVARVLGLTNEQVTVTLVTNGGAFGGKEDMSNQAHAALAGLAAAAPGEVHAVARGELPHPPQAASDRHGVLAGMRRRRAR